MRFTISPTGIRCPVGKGAEPEREVDSVMFDQEADKLLVSAERQPVMHTSVFSELSR